MNHSSHVLLYKVRTLVAESMGLFCEDLGIPAIVAQKGEMIPKDCMIYLICASSATMAEGAFADLEAQGITKTKIRWIRTYVYKPSLRPFLAQYFTKESALALWLADDIELFHQQLFSLVSAYRANRPSATESFLLRQNMSRDGRQSVFAALYSHSPRELDCIPYPGFNIHVEGDKELEDKDFYLIEPLSWESLRNRPKDTKLIAVMGNSALRVPYLPIEDTIPKLLQQQLQSMSRRYIVLNFGIAGYTVYEQMMFYNAVVALLRPEIVISLFGGTDWRTGTMNDSVLLKNFQMCYTPGFYEYNAKKLLQSHVPLFTELQIPNPEISDDDVNRAIATRLRQFHAIVCGGGGKFAAFIQPLLPCKKIWTEQEQRMWREVVVQLYPRYLHEIIVRIPHLAEKLLSAGLEYVFDANHATCESKECLFDSYWIHCNARGNELCARFVAQKLCEYGIL